MTAVSQGVRSSMGSMTFAEFFAGIGLVRLGLEKSGWKCLFANDIDPGKLEMYRVQFPDCDDHFVLDDIRNLNIRSLPPVDLATASFPCTDLSLAGARAGLAGDHSSALWPFMELLHKLDHMRPRLVLLENVTGFLTSHGGADFKSALLALNRLGYAVDALVLDAIHFVPQSRPRLFVVGIHRRARVVVERPRHNPRFFESALRPAALADFIYSNPDVMWELRELPNLPNRSHSLADVLEPLKDSATEWWNASRAEYLLNQMSDRHRLIADNMINDSQVSYGTVFRRVRNGRSMAELRTDGIAGCLRTPKGGSGRQILFVAGMGKFRVRLLTARECARLMGADDFPIACPLNQALFGFGDAVCVHAIDWIAVNYLNPALGELTDSESIFAYA